MSDQFVQWATYIMELLGEPGAGLLIALENIIPPIPSEVILPLVGLTASQGDFSLVIGLFWTTTGSVVGALALYYLGFWLGRERTRSLCVRIPFVKLSDIDKTEMWFIKHETKAVFYGRMIPVFRSLISIPAGVEKMSLITFVSLTAAGSFIWNGVLIGLGFTFGENLELISRYVQILQTFVIVGTLILIGKFFFTRYLRKR